MPAILEDKLHASKTLGLSVNKGIESFRTTLNALFVAGSTDTCLGCFITTYTAHHALGLFWVVFLVIVQILLLTSVLDTPVASYTA